MATRAHSRQFVLTDQRERRSAMIVQFAKSGWKTAFLVLAVTMIAHLLISPWYAIPPDIGSILTLPPSNMMIGNDIVN